jgi:hypothetical protein
MLLQAGARIMSTPRSPGRWQEDDSTWEHASPVPPSPLVVMAVKASITSKHRVHATSCYQSYTGTSSLLLTRWYPTCCCGNLALTFKRIGEVRNSETYLTSCACCRNNIILLDSFIDQMKCIFWYEKELSRQKCIFWYEKELSMHCYWN